MEAVEIEAVDCFCVVLAENEDGSGFLLSLTVPLTGYSEQDESLGQATYSISDIMGRTVYGGIDSWSHDGKNQIVFVDLSRGSAELFGLSRSIELWIVASEEKFAEVIEGLERVIGVG